MKTVTLVTSALILSACSHATLTPEVGDEGAIAVKSGIVYSIPAEKPVLKMKLASLTLKDKKLLHIRMYFHRLGSPAGQYLDPREQSITIAGSPIYPSRVHAYAAQKPIVSLADPERQVVELEFPVPPGGPEYTFVNFNWKIHYKRDGKPQVEAQTERYDYNEKHAPQEGVGRYSGDLEFPDAEPWMFPDDPNWIGPGWMWWPGLY